MATKPDLIKWVASDDPTRIEDPGTTKKSNGFLYLEKPAFQFFNYLFNRIYKWFLGLQGAYVSVVVGSSSQVSSNEATHTINQLNDSTVPTTARVLILEGTHTLTGNITLTNANISIKMESGAAIIDLASTYKITLSGARTYAMLKFTNVIDAADAISISGASSIATLLDVLSKNVTASSTSNVTCVGTASVVKLNGIELPRFRFQAKSADYVVVRHDNGSVFSVDTSGAARAMTLPALADVDESFIVGFRKETSDANTVTISRASTDTIEGATSLILNAIGDVVILMKASATRWMILSNNIAPPVAQAILTKSGSNLLLSRKSGSRLFINGVNQIIPAAGITLAPTSLSSTTLYYIYAYMNSGVMALEASTTVPVSDTSTGVEIKTGDATRTLVGMARTNGSTAWVDTRAQRFVRSWFNRQRVDCGNAFAAERSTSDTAFVELSSTERAEFIVWSGENVSISTSGRMVNTDGGGNEVMCSIGIDDETAEDTLASGLTGPGSVFVPASCGLDISSLSEGYHYATILGKSGGGTNCIWAGSATPGTRTTISVSIG